jgi:hypothetical protein
MNRLLILLLLCSPLVLAEGEYPSELEGLYYLWGDPIDKNNEPGVDGFTIFLQGEAAERLYKKIETEAVHNECWDDGTLTKFAENVECSLSPNKEYSCAFSVNLKDQKVYRAETC